MNSQIFLQSFTPILSKSFSALWYIGSFFLWTSSCPLTCRFPGCFDIAVIISSHYIPKPFDLMTSYKTFYQRSFMFPLKGSLLNFLLHLPMFLILVHISATFIYYWAGVQISLLGVPLLSFSGPCVKNIIYTLFFHGFFWGWQVWHFRSRTANREGMTYFFNFACQYFFFIGNFQTHTPHPPIGYLQNVYWWDLSGDLF